MKQFSTFFLIFLLIVSCAKKRTAIVKGRVLNPVTGEGISNAKITMYHSKLTSYDNDIKVDAQTFSASDGSFEISSKGFKAYELACVLDGDYYYLNWFEGGEYKSSFQPLEGKTQDVDFHAIPYGTYKISIFNNSCNGINDTIIINRTNDVNSFLGNDWVLTGCVNYTTSESKVPMGNIHTVYTVKKNGITTVFETDFMVQANELNVQTINY
jgi:hypothetical protein